MFQTWGNELVEEVKEQVPEPATLPLRMVLRDLGLSNAELKRAAATGKVHLRGVPTADLGRQVVREQVSYLPEAKKLTPERDLAILYRDEHIAVVWKPSGWLSVRANNQKKTTNVVGFVKKLFGEGLAVHRLDQETSGLMMVALTESAQTGIKGLLKEHDVERRYLALVQGRPAKSRWTTESMLVRNRGDGKRGTGEAHNAKRAFTSFRLIEKLHGASLIEATLETGRTHQVRIHLAEAGHPVLGDKLYGTSGSSRKSPRVALHAAVLGLKHPVTGEQLKFDAPLADELELLRRSLGEFEKSERRESSNEKPGRKAPRKKYRSNRKRKSR